MIVLEEGSIRDEKLKSACRLRFGGEGSRATEFSSRGTARRRLPILVT
jgi:hypothetical protein